VLIQAGHNTLTSVSWQLRRDTTNRGPLIYKGTSTSFNWESVGLLGGEGEPHLRDHRGVHVADYSWQ